MGKAMQSTSAAGAAGQSSVGGQPATDGSADRAFSLLDALKRAACVAQPFPHLVVDDCLPQSSYCALVETFPADLVPEAVRITANKRYDIFSSWGSSPNDLPSMPAPWRVFVAQNETADMARMTCSRLMPQLVLGEGELFQPLAGPGAVDPGDIRVRVSVGVNTQAAQQTSVRGPHCDRLTKAFVGLYYLKDPAEGRLGGDLLLYRWKPGRKPRRAWPATIDEADVELGATIEYAPNRLVLFMNADEAIHGVSPRLPGVHFRRLVVISGWFPGYRTDPGTAAALGLSAG